MYKNNLDKIKKKSYNNNKSIIRDNNKTIIFREVMVGVNN